MTTLLIVLFILLVIIGVPVAFVLGVVSLTGLAALPDVPNMVVFSRMFNSLNSFPLLAVPLFILAANLMNEGSITDRLISCCKDLVGRFRGGLAYANILVSMIFAGISGSSQADTAGVGKVFIPAMEAQGYDKETSVGVTAASSTLGSIIPPSITMVIYAGIANVGTGALFMTGIIPGVLLGLAQMIVVRYYSIKKSFPKGERVPLKEVCLSVLRSLPALLVPIILIGGIGTGLFTPTESAAVACVYALIIGIFVYKTITLKRLWNILIDTMALSALSLFALATASALGELMGYYQVNAALQNLLVDLSLSRTGFLAITVVFFLFLGTFMDAVPAMILFVPVLLPTAVSLGVSPLVYGLIVVITLALGLVTPPYGLCLMIASSISNLSIERSFKGSLPYFLSAVAVLLLLICIPDLWLMIPKAVFPNIY